MKSIAALLALILLGNVALPPARNRFAGTFGISAGPGPYISGSRVRLSLSGIAAPYALQVLGGGDIVDSVFTAPLVRNETSSTIVGAAAGALGLASIGIVPPPAADRPVIAVASYDNGIALHDPASFAILGYIGLGEAPGDVALGSAGMILAPSTTGSTLFSYTRNPWTMHETPNIPLGNEVAIDHRTGDVFVSNRDVAGHGALTRITQDGVVSRVVTGQTAEGLAIDQRAGIIYVGNVNDASVLALDASTLKPVHRIKTGPRPFGLALDAQDKRLFVVSNASNAPGGYVAAYDVHGGKDRLIARSPRFVFPLGVVYDSTHHRIFVTDEAANVVYVLDSRTLASVHAPLITCSTPWRPSIDLRRGRLYVPCARANRVAVYSLRSLRQLAGSPFATGGFPLSIAS